MAFASGGAFGVVFVAATLALHGCGGGESSPPSPTPSVSPSPSPTTMTTTTTTTPQPVKCSEAFKGCAAQSSSADDAGCFVRAEDDAAAFAGCDAALQSHFQEYKSKVGDLVALNDLVLGGATGTCLTALRYLHTVDKQQVCPMPLPPRLDDIEAGDDAFNLFTLGDWGPTPMGQTWGSCPCSLVPEDQCRVSLFNVLSKAPGLCKADTWERSNNAQQLVADAMAKHAEEANPVMVMSLGDNFYMGGVPTPHNIQVHDALHVDPTYAFQTAWHDVYLQNENGQKLNVPWLSVFGNHDYGGAGCLADWQTQIDFTKTDPTKNWRFPFEYYKQRIHTKTYDVDIFMLEVNEGDIQATDDHGICHQKLCGALKGDEATCKQRMLSKIDEMFKWLEVELQSSVAEGVRWRILAGHFPFGTDAEKITTTMGKQYGAALYVSGHTHSMLFHPETDKAVPIFISGAGGGYRKEGDGDFYGFGNLAFSKDKITVSLLDEDAKVTQTHDIMYQAPPPLPTQAAAPSSPSPLERFETV